MPKPSFFILSALLASTLLSSKVKAEVLSNEALYYRCYSRITGMRVPSDDPQLAAVKNLTLDAIQACLNHLDKAKLNTANNTTITDSVIGMNVLSHMHLVHSSFFSVRGLNTPVANDNQASVSYDLLDPTAPALFYTRAMFTDGIKAETILNGKANLRALRQTNDPTVGALSRTAKTGFHFALFPENNFLLVGQGLMRGIESLPTLNYKYYSLGYELPPNPLPAQTGAQLYAAKCASCHNNFESSTVRNRALATITKKMTAAPHSTLGLTAGEVNLIYMYLQEVRTIKYGDSEGGGFIGTHAYLMKTVDQDSAFRADLSSMPRRWATSVFHDTLCRELPLIRVEDGESFAIPTSTIPFRTAKSCTQCHATMDRAASTLRNFQYFTIPQKQGTSAAGVLYQMATVDQSPESGWPAVADANYYRRPPKGTLYYRTASTGDLVDLSVENIDELGTRLSQQDDFYICLANRYWDYLSGKGVKMNDKKIMDGYSATEKARFQKVKDWGLALKNRPDQSLRWMLEQMLRSPEFADSAFGP